MKDIPVFTTDFGVASLTLKEIPYSGKAYVRVQSSLQPNKLIEECISFCRAAGAEAVYGIGHSYLSKFNRHCRIIRMCRSIENAEDTDACLFPVTEKTIEEFRNIYNDAMKFVPNASYMTVSDSQKVLSEGSGYFVHRNGTLLGIGVVNADMIHAIASVVPGEGRNVMLALFHALTNTVARLEVAEENIYAMRLYEKMGFVSVEEVAVWYKIF